MLLSDIKQVVPAIGAFLAADSTVALLSTALTLGVPSGQDEPQQHDSWLGDDAEDLAFGRRWALLLALAFWRAEQMQSLLERTKRACANTKSVGFGRAIGNALANPIGWSWPGFWGIARRVALVAVSSCGCSAFMLTVFPAVALDGFLWWVLAEAQNKYSKRGGKAVPPAVDMVCQIIDRLHFVPVITRVFFLGIAEYSQVSWPLTVCALAWTGHNCHAWHNAVCNELPETFRKLFGEARSDDE